jgi:hypothetical protein
MSEHITHTGSLDDCFRLMTLSDEICEPFRLVAREQRDFARLGGITRYGDEFTVSMLTSYRERWSGRTPEDRLEPKLAFVLGWLCHRAADRQVKPLFRALDPTPTQNPRDCSIYNDAVIYHEVYAGGAAEPFHPHYLEKELPGEDIFRVLLQRALLELHTLIPDRQDGEGWLDKLFTLQQKFYVDIDRYAEAILHPDPEKMRRFIEEPNFYDAADPIVATARAIQRGESVSAEQVRAATDAEPKSHYAQMLHMGFGYLKAASDYFESRISSDELADRLNIGRPGRDGKSV